jgi:hypothetical protein
MTTSCQGVATRPLWADAPGQGEVGHGCEEEVGLGAVVVLVGGGAAMVAVYRVKERSGKWA